MSLTLGQKLKQAREALGIPVSEVAAQTRIAPLYIESIDNDDYRALPGGIFNRGFVKSYAKYVGVDEQEALADYATLLNDTEGNDVEEVKTYKPQVLTDGNSNHSMIPTVIGAAIILGLMTGGILFLVKFISQPTESYVENSPVKSNINAANTNSAIEVGTPLETSPSSVPEMATVKVEFKAVTEPVSLTAVVDDNAATSEISAGSSKIFEPKKAIKLSYSRSRANFAQLEINGKPVTLPSAPINPKRPAIIEFEINRENLERIWTNGAIAAEGSPAAPSPKKTLIPEKPKTPTVSNTTVSAKPANTAMKPANKATR